jgi:hypothetical protein
MEQQQPPPSLVDMRRVVQLMIPCVYRVMSWVVPVHKTIRYMVSIVIVLNVMMEA